MIVALTMILVVLLILVDQLSKLAVYFWLPALETHPIIPGFVQFHYAENTGAAFGMFSNGRVFFIILTSLVMIAGLYILLTKKLKNNVAYFSVALLVAGGFGNLIDRVFRGYVIDFIEPIFMRFAIFNLADCLITFGAVGIIGYLIYDIVQDHREEKKKAIRRANRTRGVKDKNEHEV